MSGLAENAQLESLLKDSIPELADLYDKFANPFNPLDSDVYEATNLFNEKVGKLFIDSNPRIRLHDFKKAIITRCRRHLKSKDKPSSI